MDVFFYLKVMTYQKNVTLFVINSVLISKYNLIASLSTIKSHGDKVIYFYYSKNTQVAFGHTYLAVISVNYALKKDGNHYPQVFLKECKYIEKKVVRHITDELEGSSDDSDDSGEE